MDWRQRLRVRTQDPGFLKWMVATILISGVVVGFAVDWAAQWLGRNDLSRLEAAVGQARVSASTETFADILQDSSTPFEDILEVEAVLARRVELGTGAIDLRGMQPDFEALDADDIRQLLEGSKLDESAKALSLALWQSLVDEQPTPELLALANVRYGQHALGVFWESMGDDVLAAESYVVEGRRPEAARSRADAVRLYVMRNDTEGLRGLSNDPLYRGEIPTIALLEIAVADRDWWRVLALIPQNEWERISLGPACLATFTGLCWFMFSIQAGQVGEPKGARLWLCLAAIPCGFLSIFLTHLLILWQESTWGLVFEDSLSGGLRYFILGVGLREEFAKFVFVLPLIPFIIRRSELEALIVSACVGLGFAILENEHYFSTGIGANTLGRFLTANFFHMSATGLIGLAAARAVRDPQGRLPEAIAVFGVIVIVHGIYDSAIVITALTQFSIASSILYILLAYRFFHELRSMRTQRRETISLTANFLCGVSLLIAVTFVYMCGTLGIMLACAVLPFEILSTILMVYMFLREMPNSLIARSY